MATFLARATPAQAKLFRMIEGACVNAAHAHPQWEIDRRFAPSIAKRAAGTIVAGWPDVLAASAVSMAGADTLLTEPAACGCQGTNTHKWGASHCQRRAPLPLLFQQIGKLAQTANRSGQTERHQALVDALRLIGAARDDGRD